jgi:hypothetical protein
VSSEATMALTEKVLIVSQQERDTMTRDSSACDA